jgi:NDP-sugar pyrophosphorylase family protein
VSLPVAILAGGLATRLRPITERIPKAMIEIDGRPFIEYQLELLRENGVRRIVMCVGHLGEQIEDAVGDGSKLQLDVVYSRDGDQLVGTGGALRQALPLLGEMFLIAYGDSYMPCDYRAIERAFIDSKKAGLMTVLSNDGRWDASNVLFDGQRIVAYDKQRRTPEMRHIDYGVGALRADALHAHAVKGPLDLADVYKTLVAKDQLAAFEVNERFYEIGSPAGLEDTRAFLHAKDHS